MTAVVPIASGCSSRTRLACLLAVSYGLRVWLSIGGGQDYWPDEARYGLTREAAYQLAHRHWKLACDVLLRSADHVLFRWVGLPIATVEYYIGGQHPALAACYFGLFSVGVIYMVWAVARRAGASESEAIWAAFLAAAANSLFYYTRHYFPYDISLFAMLVGLWLAVGPCSAANSFRAGVAVGLGFLSYNGYWLLGACVLTLHSLLGAGGSGRFVIRATSAFLGLILPLALFLALGAAVSGGVLNSYAAFAGSVKQGDFHVGYRVIPEYLWHSEGVLSIILLVAFCYGLAAAKGRYEWRRLRWWGASVVFIYSGLVFFSDVVPTFMVYGRLTRVLVPFLCLGAGMGVDRFLTARGNSRRAWSAGAFLVIACLAAVNFTTPLRQVFPDEFLRLFGRMVSRASMGRYGFVRVLYAEPLWGRSLDNAGARVEETELLRRSNPMQFRPYQYEGYTAAQRLELNAKDVAMRVLETPMEFTEKKRWSGYPGPIKMTVTFPKNHTFSAEPLICSGKPGRGDIVYVRYVDSNHIAFGLEHSEAGATESKAVEIDYGRPHELVISAGSLVPPPESETDRREPALQAMRGHFLVILDGRLVRSTHAEFYPSPRNVLCFGINLIGGSTTEPVFNGRVWDFGQASFDRISSSIPGLAGGVLARCRSSEWDGAVGPFRIRFEMPAWAPGPNEGQPLASIEGPQVREVFFIVRDGAKVRIGIDSLGLGAVWSDPVDLSPSGADEAEICIGSLLPEIGAAIYSHAPNFVGMRKMIAVRLNHRLVLFSAIPTKTAGACSVVFGANTVGSSACTQFFKGEITSIEAIGLEDIPAGQTAASGFMDKLARPGWNGYTGPLGIEIEFAECQPGACQPILTTGIAGAGDVVFVRYEPDGMARICLDHWGTPLTVSKPFPLEPGARHVLRLSLGSLYPPESSKMPGNIANLDSLRNRITVDVDGRRLLDCPKTSYPTQPEWITIGANFIGGTSVGATFFGEIGKVTRVPLEAVSR